MPLSNHMPPPRDPRMPPQPGQQRVPIRSLGRKDPQTDGLFADELFESIVPAVNDRKDKYAMMQTMGKNNPFVIQLLGMLDKVTTEVAILRIVCLKRGLITEAEFMEAAALYERICEEDMQNQLQLLKRTSESQPSGTPNGE